MMAADSLITWTELNKAVPNQCQAESWCQMVWSGWSGSLPYLRAECRSSSPHPRHSPPSEYLCNRKGSTDAGNRERAGKHKRAALRGVWGTAEGREVSQREGWVKECETEEEHCGGWDKMQRVERWRRRGVITTGTFGRESKKGNKVNKFNWLRQDLVTQK